MADKKQDYWQKQLEIAYGNPIYKKWRKSARDITRRYRNQAFSNMNGKRTDTLR